MKLVDARGCACPEPVMMTREAMYEDPNHIVVLVDETCAVENVTRFAKNFGFIVTTEQDGDETKLTWTK